ncbi:hypothetical protein BO71DRAFT_402099 [Aspergillus ellipticus CBS 707.79]|uniref:Uncharacterized protein n=1 Tax=Aspergillus ellipticus CBS 707.79 TaxID=1448320 RepID=A0A319EI01_9EURO|nr:hypothetical protein BO71DRAFT_402099 [Aspergillus ellipticus CBS 707.79]
MSGSNPFRPKKPQNSLPPPPTTFPSFPSPSPSTSAGAPPVTTFKSLARPPPPPPASLTPDLDDHDHDHDHDHDPASSDDQSVSDPFHHSSYATDKDGGEEEQDVDDDDDDDDEDVDLTRPYRVSAATPGDDDRSHPPIRPVPDPAVPPRGPALPATTAAALGQISSREHPVPLGHAGPSRENAPVAGSTVSTLSSTSHGGIRTPDSSTTDVSRPPDLRPPLGPRTRSNLSSSSEVTSRPLASRPGNRDRVPPPPPKSHHGKRIAPNPGPTPSFTQTTPGRSTSRFSFHGSPSEPSHSPRPSQSGPSDYFVARSESQPAQPAATDTLRRSQSQYKRPPTPPLSRRHSQMRRSKTTLSKVNPLRLSVPAAQETTTSSSSPPPSPGAWSLNPSRTRESRTGSTPSEELADAATSSLRPDSSSASSSTETSASMPGPSTKRSSLYNSLPPPPPPRRSRGSSNHSNDSSGLGLQPSKPVEEAPAAAPEQFIPHPSNANDILADLTRLQKEVDDLRGHYEGRKASQ